MMEVREMRWRTCQFCSAHLDPGEICDCQKETTPSVVTTGSGAAVQKTTKQYTPYFRDLERKCQE